MIILQNDKKIIDILITGTELYDPERGGFVDISILDVLQIFGRAGRPQYDNCGHGILITPHKTLNKYISLIGLQVLCICALWALYVLHFVYILYLLISNSGPN